MNASYIMVYCTCPSIEIAEEIAQQLVEKQLAACVNVIPSITSIYSWEGKLEKATETLLLIKTTQSLYEALESSLLKLHPYDCPEVIGVPIDQGNKGYLQWIKNTLTQ